LTSKVGLYFKPFCSFVQDRKKCCGLRGAGCGKRVENLFRLEVARFGKRRGAKEGEPSFHQSLIHIYAPSPVFPPTAKALC